VNRRNRLEARVSGGSPVRIGGKEYNVHFARIVFKCGECLGKLRIRDHGLICQADASHRGYIHRDEAKAIKAEQQKQMTEIEAVYEIVDGQIVAKER